MLYWMILYCRCYGGAVHAVLEESCLCCVGRYFTVCAMVELFMLCWRRAVQCSCCIGRYCTVGAMMDLFMLCWRILNCRCYAGAVHAVLDKS
jgi:hypothetical protein